MTRNTSRSRKPSTTKREQQLNKIKALQAQVEKWQEEMDDEEIALVIASIQGYSDRNSMLIAMQCPTATTVRGYRAWIELGRKVDTGQHGIAILAPAGSKTVEKADAKDSEQQGPEKDGDGKTVRKFFRITYVFDIAQTHVMTEEEKALATRKLGAYESENEE